MFSKITFALILVLLSSNTAWSKNFYKAKMRMQLTYSSAFDKTRTLERGLVEVVMSDDSNSYNNSSFCLLRMKSTTYPCGARLSSVRSYGVAVDAETLKKILADQFDIKAEILNGLKLDENYSIARSYSSYSGTDRKTSFQLHTEKGNESYHLNVVARKAHKQ